MKVQNRAQRDGRHFYLELDQPQQLRLHIVDIRIAITVAFLLALCSCAIVALGHRRSAVARITRSLEHITCAAAIVVVSGAAAVERGIGEVRPQPTALSTVQVARRMEARAGRVAVLQRNVLRFEGPRQLIHH